MINKIIAVILAISVLLNIFLILAITNNMYGKVNYLTLDKQMEIDRKIIVRYKTLQYYARKGKIEALQSVVNKPYKRFFKKKVFSNKNYPLVVYWQDMNVSPDKDYNKDMLKLYEYIERLHNQIYYHCNYITVSAP